MNYPIQITFLHIETSPAVETRIREEAEQLGRNGTRITHCRVVVDAPHHHHRNGHHYQIRIDLAVPGTEIVINHQPSSKKLVSAQVDGRASKHLETEPDHKDLYVAIRDAFEAARRRLDHYHRRLIA